jgi:hypothetical protein
MSVGEQLTHASPELLAERVGHQARWALWLFGATIFLSAFLLFLVQPILGKMILPWFGGGAGVWAACLLFFQASLLAGYAYAHCLRRFLSSRWQMQLHILLLAASILLLPILPSPEWRRLGHIDPAIRILGLLAVTIGLPYLLISSTSPLLQAWYAAIKPGASAYRLYALSNLGSMLGLICFPLLVESCLASRAQAWGWSGAYVFFTLLCAAVAWYAWRHRKEGSNFATSNEASAPNLSPVAASPVRIPIQLLWVGLAACGSALMMATTSALTQNFAPIPLLWILPLGLYLFSFVLCFETERVYQRLIWIPAMLVGLGAMAFVMFDHGGSTNLKLVIPAMLGGLFCCCMVCHGELARHKPDTRFLTYFYLLISAGGVLGGFFVAIVAPHIFRTYVELPLWMAVCVLLTLVIAWKETRSRGWILKTPARLALMTFLLALVTYMGVHKYRVDRHYHLQVRNFYGVLQVEDIETGNQDGRVRSLVHGTIEHGAQLLDPDFRHEPTLYYIHTSGVGLAMQFLKGRGRMHVGAIGLGAGVLASYCRIGDVYRFYDINPEVIKIANSEFTFLHDCPGKVDVSLGDARLMLESQPPQDFDLLVVDAFSGDAIPVHLLTREAVIEYFRHLNSEGILAVHVSNKYLDLVPIVAGIAENLGKHAIGVFDADAEGKYPASSDWVLVTGNPAIFNDPIFEADSVEDVRSKSNLRGGGDDYSNVLQILNLNKITDEEQDNPEN